MNLIWRDALPMRSAPLMRLNLTGETMFDLRMDRINRSSIRVKVNFSQPPRGRLGSGAFKKPPLLPAFPSSRR